MTSKRLKSSLSSLLQQWAAQHQEQQQKQNPPNEEGQSRTESTDASSSNDPSSFRPSLGYRILLQRTQGWETRIQASEGVGSRQAIYDRAGVRTPSEAAIRDIQGGQAWLDHVMSLALKTTTAAAMIAITATTANNSTDKNNTKTASQQEQPTSSRVGYLVVLIKTTPTRRKGRRRMDETRNLIEVDASQNSWGWDGNNDDPTAESGTSNSTTTTTTASLQDLTRLATAIRNAILQHEAGDIPNSKNHNKQPVFLAWESLSPFFVIHGFDTTMRFLSHSTFADYLQLWPVHVESLTCQQHSVMEDHANALMTLSGGTMTLLRQGIRESGNVVREVLPFRLRQRPSSNNGQQFVLEEKENDEEMVEKESSIATDNQNAATDADKEKHKSGTNGARADDSSSLQTNFNTKARISSTASSSGSVVVERGGRRPRTKVQLHIQDEDDDNHNSTGASNTNQVTTPLTTNQPRIFLEDDDPEFDDFDEEDADDDLEI